MNLSIYIHGQSGRMGQALAEVCAEHALAVSVDINQAGVIVDFSSPSGLAGILPQAIEAGKPLVCGTTGLQAEHLQAMRDAARIIPVLWSANMSIGMNLLYRLAEQAAGLLSGQADCEILETHHQHKKDAPSGSALELGRRIAAAQGQEFEAVARFNRNGPGDAREQGEIGFSSVRAGDIVGEHAVLFGMPGERLELTHRATDRRIFARGAVHAACWLAEQAPGWYVFADSLDQA